MGTVNSISISTVKTDVKFQGISKKIKLPSQASKVQSHDSVELEGQKILLVDDSEDMRELVGYFLKSKGAEVEFAANGAAGFRMAVEDDFDIILMDIQMPEMNGLEATKSLRKSGYVKPIIALTAMGLKNTEQSCLNAGCNFYISKPVNFENLLATIRKAI